MSLNSIPVSGRSSASKYSPFVKMRTDAKSWPSTMRKMSRVVVTPAVTSISTRWPEIVLTQTRIMGELRYHCITL